MSLISRLARLFSARERALEESERAETDARAKHQQVVDWCKNGERTPASLRLVVDNIAAPPRRQASR